MSSEQTYDCALQLRIQLQSLKHGCEQFIQSGDRGIYRKEKYISQIIALARTMGTELRDIELRKKYALKYHQWIKETFEDSFVREALTIKGICPGVKSEIEKALSQLAESNTNHSDSTLASGDVLAKLLVLAAPNTVGQPGVSKWLSTLEYDVSKAESVYKKFRDIMNSNKQASIESRMTASVEHLEKLKRLVTDVHPQFEKHLPQINLYLKTAQSAKKPTFNKKSKNSQG